MEIFINNEFVDADRARIHVSDLAIQRGYGIFDFLRVRNGVPLYLNGYLDRFIRSAEIMRLQGIPDRETLRSVIGELVSRNAIPDSGIKMILTGGYSPDAYELVKGNLIISQQPLSFAPSSQGQQGIKIITHSYRREIPEVKTINYIMGVWLQSKVKESKAADVLYHMGNEVTEFPRCNFFLVTKDNEVVTPGKQILNGITRMNVLRKAAEKFKTLERTVTLDDVRSAKEAFLTSTTKGIVPIVMVDDHMVGNGRPGEVSLELQRSLAVLEKEELEIAQELK